MLMYIYFSSTKVSISQEERAKTTTLSRFVAKGAPGADRKNGSQSVPGVFSEGVCRLLLDTLIRARALLHVAYKNFGCAPFCYV